MQSPLELSAGFPGDRFPPSCSTPPIFCWVGVTKRREPAWRLSRDYAAEIGLGGSFSTANASTPAGFQARPAFCADSSVQISSPVDFSADECTTARGRRMLRNWDMGMPLAVLRHG